MSTLKIYFILILFINSYFCFSLNEKLVNPIPPQPSQYETSIEINGIKGKYYADTTIFRDRLDQPTMNSTIIIDFKIFRQYIINQNQCSYADIPGKISPLLTFSTYEYKGNVTHDQIESYQWNGCHNYEIPPAPFEYYSSIKDHSPLNLILPTVGVNIQFSNVTYGPPTSSLFDIPINCTFNQFHLQLNPIFSNKFLSTNHENLQIFC